MALDGITQVELANVRDMEISIEISEDTLRRYGMTFDEVAMAIRKSSVDLPGGSIKVKDSGEVLLRTKGQAKEVLDFEQIVLRTLPDGHACDLARWPPSSTGLRKTTGNHTSMVSAVRW